MQGKQRADRGLGLGLTLVSILIVDRARSEAAGFVQHLVKPVDLPLLVKLVAGGAHG